MPLSKYFSGHGEKVASDLKKKYGAEWERHFYAIANAKGQTPKAKTKGLPKSK